MVSGLINTFKLFLSGIFKQKLVMLFILVAQIASIFSALFLYGYFYGQYRESSNIGEFSVSYNNGASADYVLPAAFKYAKSDYPIAVMVSLDQNGLIKCDIAQSEYPTHGRFPDNFSGEKEVLVNSNLDYEIGESVELWGELYLIVGTTWHDYAIVNAGSIANDREVYSVEINDYTIRNKSEIYKKAKLIQDLFGEEPTYSKPMSISVFMLNNPIIALLVIGVILLAACSTSLGFEFFIFESKRTILSLRVCGMSGYYAKTVFFLCIFALTLASCVIGSLMYLLFDHTWIQALSIPIFGLTVHDYLIITGLMLIIPLITIVYICKKSSIRG